MYARAGFFRVGDWRWHVPTCTYNTLQYFDLRKGAVGTYGYEWVDHPDDDDDRSKRCLELNVTRYDGGKIDPTNKTFTVKGKTTISKREKGGGEELKSSFVGSLML